MESYGDMFDREIDERIADSNRRFFAARAVAVSESLAIRCPFYQPQATGPIYKDTPEGRVIWRGWFHCEGRYYSSADALLGAMMVELERAHVDALREDERRSRRQATVRYELTPLGQQAIAAPSTNAAA